MYSRLMAISFIVIITIVIGGGGVVGCHQQYDSIEYRCYNYLFLSFFSQLNIDKRTHTQQQSVVYRICKRERSRKKNTSLLYPNSLYLRLCAFFSFVFPSILWLFLCSSTFFFTILLRIRACSVTICPGNGRKSKWKKVTWDKTIRIKPTLTEFAQYILKNLTNVYGRQTYFCTEMSNSQISLNSKFVVFPGMDMRMTYGFSHNTVFPLKFKLKKTFNHCFVRCTVHNEIFRQKVNTCRNHHWERRPVLPYQFWWNFVLIVKFTVLHVHIDIRLRYCVHITESKKESNLLSFFCSIWYIII